MNTTELREVFRDFIDESDTTFFSDADVARYLSLGYDQFRSRVCEHDLSIYKVRTSFTPTTPEFDLATQDITDSAGNPQRALGSAATAGFRLYKIVRLYFQSSGSTFPGQFLKPVSSREQVYSPDYLTSKFCLEGTEFIFAAQFGGTLTFEYVPYHNVDFAAAAAFIDDLGQFHDLIALYAARYYAIADVGVNNALERKIAFREKQLEDYLTSGRQATANLYVTYTNPDFIT